MREVYGVTKFEPPVRPTDGESLPPLATFHGYTEIENLRNFPGVLREGEEVVITEKLHGKNCRLGLVRVPDEEGGDALAFVAGSNDVRRREVDAKGRPSDFWMPMTDPVRDLLRHLSEGSRSVVLFGELIGSGVQDMAYGLANGAKGFRAFDLAVDGKYLDHDAKAEAALEICEKHTRSDRNRERHQQEKPVLLLQSDLQRFVAHVRV